MNAYAQAQQAYAPTKSPMRIGRSAEIELISQVTSHLRAADKPGIPFARLAEALHDNRMMWAHFGASVADKDNALPADLRARLFYLAEFTDTHTRRILAGDASAGPLIDINSAVLRGLGAGEAG